MRRSHTLAIQHSVDGLSTQSRVSVEADNNTPLQVTVDGVQFVPQLTAIDYSLQGKAISLVVLEQVRANWSNQFIIARRGLVKQINHNKQFANDEALPTGQRRSYQRSQAKWQRDLNTLEAQYKEGVRLLDSLRHILLTK